MSAAGNEGVTHEYDGIIEHDNHLPRWWLITLYGAMVFAGGYWIWFHVFNVGVLPRQALAEEVKERAVAEEARDAAAGAVDDNTLLAMSKDPAVVARGQATFAASCLACHGDKGQGVVGPNLTDAAWIHGSAPTRILTVVAEGVAAKGMPAWKPALGSVRVKEAVAYVLTLKNTNAAGKAPEGSAP